jgi:hypothetical protein
MTDQSPPNRWLRVPRVSPAFPTINGVRLLLPSLFFEERGEEEKKKLFFEERGEEEKKKR